MIVDRLSATRNCDEAPIPVNEDHQGIVKPSDVNHDSYIALRNAIKQLEETSKTNATRTGPRGSIGVPVSGEPLRVGTPVASLALLDVGAVPPEQSPIPDPPGWVEPKSEIKLVFRDSPLLTEAVRTQARRDVSAFREYLLGLQIPVSDEFPSIGVGAGPAKTTQVLPSMPAYRSRATIAQDWLVDRRALTAQYSNYAIEELLTRRIKNHPPNSGLQDVMAASAISGYYNRSFWDSDIGGGRWTVQLWEIRRAFGKGFTDKLVAFALKAIADDPEEEADANFDIYFYKKLRISDEVIESAPGRIDTIKAIIEKSGIDVTTPKAKLDFAATAVGRKGGTILVDLSVSNQTEIPAARGELRIYFAPDVDLLREAKGSMKDPSTTLKSARLVPFDLIAARASQKAQIELRPIAGAFRSDSLIIGLGYTCETCIKDTYDHSLKFDLNQLPAKICVNGKRCRQGSRS